MAKYNGVDAVLKVESSPGSSSYSTIGGVISHTMTLNNEAIDVSDKDSSRWRDMLNAGQRSLQISLNGWISDDANYELLADAADNDSILSYQFLYGNSKTCECDFHVDSLERGGEYNNAQTFSCTLSNDGTPTFTG
jgi:predicted secreted protein